jgi:hypothetical protein
MHKQLAKALWSRGLATPTDVPDERKLYLRKGDIIAVTEKHDNGRWIGVLLDERRYDPNRDSFLGSNTEIIV